MKIIFGYKYTQLIIIISGKKFLLYGGDHENRDLSREPLRFAITCPLPLWADKQKRPPDTGGLLVSI